MHLSLRLLGTFEAQLDQDKPIESRAKKIEALLAFLACESDRAHRRERLVGLLFSEMPDDQARTNLRQTLTRLRRAINDQKADPPFLLVSREATQFNPASDHFLDVAFFEQLLQGCGVHRPERDLDCHDCNERLAKAIELYRGPFLDEFFLDDSAAFEDWVQVKREQYQTDALTALQDLADYHERGGSYAAAADFVRQQLRFEPWKEEAHRQLMRLLAYQGQRTAALQQYHVLETTLEDELSVEPMAETQSLYERIRTAEDIRPFRLPSRNDNFVGREKEMALVNEYLTDPEKRLVLLTGPGGSGKTAIAIETGWRVAGLFLGPFIHGVFFVPLAGIEAGESESVVTSTGFDPDITAIAEAIGFSFSGSRHPKEQLLSYLHDKSLLLIIDNAEHIITQVRPLIRDLLYHAPEVKLLLTSRERFGLIEEWVIDIEGLPYPGSDYAVPAGGTKFSERESAISQYQAVALFERQGRRLVPELRIGDDPGDNCSFTAVQRIAHLVQGLPLGIELAASWLRMLSCTEIAQEIANSLDFLSSTMHDLPSRHRSLRAVFDSSWQLLNPQEQQALRRLSIFHGPFERKAATAITGVSLTTLSALVDHSMLKRQDIEKADHGVAHYELHAVLRQYAAERLEENAAERDSVRQQHAAFFLQFLHEQEEILTGKDQLEAVTAISQSIQEIRSAWRWAVRNKDITGLERALVALSQFYYMRSWFSEGVDLLELAWREIEASQKTPQTEAFLPRIKARLGWFTFLAGKRQQGRILLEESVDCLRSAGHPLDLAYSLSFTAAAHTMLGDYEAAKRLAEEALAINEQHRYAYGCAIANNILSQIAYQQGEYLLSRKYCEASLGLERAIGNHWSLGFSLTNLGRVAYALQDYDVAYQYLREGLAIRQTLDDKRGQGLCLRFLGETASAQGKFDQAQGDLEESLAIFRTIGNLDESSATLNSLGDLARTRQNPADARRLYTEALKVAKEAAAMPRILDATIRLARLMAADDVLQAAKVAVIVCNHPATNQSSRELAASLLDELRAARPQEMADLSEMTEASTDIDTLADEILAVFV